VTAGTFVARFDYSGAAQSWTVPAGVSALTVDVAAARGGWGGVGMGGWGGRVEATLSVSEGALLGIYVGGAGGDGTRCIPCWGGGPGWNGGGGQAVYGWFPYGGGGGGSDIRLGGSGLEHRVLVAGGGGGNTNFTGVTPGHGGGLVGGSGGFVVAGTNGQGGTQSAGGAAGCNGSNCGTAGALGQGGNTGTGAAGGAGGGGFYGGGGGVDQGAGGGGSNYADALLCSSVTHTQGFQNGNGYVILSFAYP
jgi:hypothetical protein